MSRLSAIRSAWQEFSAIDADTHASSITYYTFLSLVPLLAICISLVSLVGVGEQEVSGFLTSLVPEPMGDLTSKLLSDAYERSGIAFSISTLSLLWAATKGANALRTGLNVTYGEQETRGSIAVMVISVVTVIAVGLLLAATLWLVFGSSLMGVLMEHVPALKSRNDALNIVEAVLTFVVGVLIMTLCYTFLPAGHRPLSSQVPGAVCAMVGCSALSYGFHLYAHFFGDITLLYGSIAAIALLLLWMYLVFYTLIAGAFINRYLRSAKEG